MDWHLFPTPRTRKYRDGDLVFQRSKSAKEKGRRGSVISVNGSRALVRFSSNKGSDNCFEKSVQLKRLLPVYIPKTTSLLCTSETIHYRLLAASQLSDTDDHVLEIGCSNGEASLVIARYASSWVGYDTSSEMIQQCKEKSSTLNEGATNQRHALKIDPFADPKMAKETATKFSNNGPTVIFVDIGGNRDLDPVIRMIAWSVDSFSPRLVIVKSRSLAKEITTLEMKGDSSHIIGADQWFSKRVKILKAKGPPIPQHPLQAPLALSPLDGTPICRYYNYHPFGCKKVDCRLDHQHCHLCQREGHIARNCSPALLS